MSINSAGVEGAARAPVRVVIIDDQNVFREMLAEIIDADPRYRVVAQCSSASQGIAALLSQAPDLLIVDLVLSDDTGFAVIRAARKALPTLAIVVITAHERPNFVAEALELGVQGIVMKGTPLRQLREAVARVAQGGTYYCALTSQVVANLLRRDTPAPRLTPREREVVGLVAQGMSSKEIGAHLHLSTKTVDNHRFRIMRKLDIHDVAGLTRFAIEHGIIAT